MSTNKLCTIGLLAPALLQVSACSGVQSALSPGGEEATRVVLLSWIMFGGGAAILLLVIVLTGLALNGPASWKKRLANSCAVVALGLVFPVVVLSALLSYGFIVMRLDLPASPPTSSSSSAARPTRSRLASSTSW